MKTTTICLCLFSLMFPLLLPAQEQVEVTNIQVWVKVLDSSGKPVEGMQRDDFEIYEDDVRMAPTCFEETRMTVPQTVPGKQESVEVTAPAPAPQTSKKFVLFLDFFNTSTGEFNLIRPKIQQFLDQLKERQAEVMVAALTPAGKLGIVTQYTRDLEAVKDLMNRAPSNPGRDQRVREHWRQIEQLFANMNERVADTMFNNAYSLASLYSDEEKADAEFSLAALESFAAHLKQMQSGEHAVILFVSGGFNADPGRLYYDIIDKIAESRGYSIGSSNWAMAVPNSVRHTSFDVRREVQKSIGRLNRYNMTVYSVNTRGMYVPGGSITAYEREFIVQDSSYLMDFQESLAQIAEETGGTAFMNSQNFKLGFDRVLEDLDHQYMICFMAPEHKTKGDYHKIKVVIHKPGVNLRYRQGYVD